MEISDNCGWNPSPVLRTITPHLLHLQLTNLLTLRKHRYKGKEGHYGKAIQALQSQGVAHPSNTSALVDLQSRHPQNPLPTPLSNYPATLSVSPEMISSCLSSFPKGSSPGSSNFRIQHLFEPICHSWAPASQECLHSLTLWLNHLLSGKAHPLLAPWLCGAPLTALHKKCQQGFRPIAVGEIFRRLTSKICCQHIKTNLPQFFIPHGQLGVGIKGGLEAMVAAQDSIWCLFKIVHQAHRTKKPHIKGLDKVCCERRETH